MSGSQERTQSLDSQWSGSNQGPTARSHPDSCASLAELQAETAAARDKLVSEVGSLLARSLMSRSEELERSTSEATRDAATVLASLCGNREYEQLSESRERSVPASSYSMSSPVQSGVGVCGVSGLRNGGDRTLDQLSSVRPIVDILSSSLDQGLGGPVRDSSDIHSRNLLVSGDGYRNDNLLCQRDGVSSAARNNLIPAVSSSQTAPTGHETRHASGLQSSLVDSDNISQAISQIVADVLRPLISTASSQSLAHSSSLQSREFHSAQNPGVVRGIDGTVPSFDEPSHDVHARNISPVLREMFDGANVRL